jgi:hypothetical protein
MARYAEKTKVGTDASQAEIKRTVQRYGATAFMAYEDQNRAVIAFEMKGRRIMFRLPLPDRKSREFTHTPARGTLRAEEDAFASWEQACRQRWRALALAIKAKMESVEAHIETFEDAFMAHIVLPGGATVGDHLRPQIADAYETGQLPPLLPAPSKGDA